MWHFVLGSPSPVIRLRTAEIALRLLGYRTAEMKPVFGVSESRYEIASSTLRHNTHWYFASQWCRCLIQAPPVPELLDTFRQLVEDTLWIRSREFDRRGLLLWLKNFGAEADELFRLIESEPDDLEEHTKEYIYSDKSDWWYRIGFT
ncbi:hypothetical protein B0H13DRAFT_1892513 [Mycena leptocephala]|nr:hypothetical protein B0H13DRAFT_1892513 [Mycena leptocephala]